MLPIENFDKIYKILRSDYFVDTTIGGLWLPDKNDKFCWTLEDAVRPHGIKISRHTAIPETGISLAYYLGLRYSPRFKREMPIIYSELDKCTIKGMAGVTFKYAQIHGGNTHKNTEGCPLVCYNRINDTTIQGTAEKEVTASVKDFIDKGMSVGISIVNLPQTK